MQGLLKVWKMIVNTRASIVVFQSVLALGSWIGVTPSSLGPKRRTWLDAKETDVIRADLSSSECWILTNR